MLLYVNRKSFRRAGLGVGVRFLGTQIFFAGHLLCAVLFCSVLKSEPLVTCEFVYPKEMSKVSNHYWKEQILKLIEMR